MGLGRSVLLLGVLGAAIAITWRAWTKPSTPRWGDGGQWSAFLKVYDETALELYGDCDVHDVPGKFGTTHVFVCGPPELPPLILIPGIVSTALFWGSWMVPTLRRTHQVVIADYICDVGRSVPLNYTTQSCPKSHDDLKHWVQELVNGLQLRAPVALAGYSYGAFIAASVGLHDPERQLLDRIALIAPAGVVGSISLKWFAYLLVSIFVYAGPKGHLFHDFMASNPEFDFERDAPPDYVRLNAVAKELGGYAEMGPEPRVFTDAELQSLAGAHPTMLVIGDREVVIDATTAINNARKVSSLALEVLPNASHLLFMEPAGAMAVDKLVAFFHPGEDGDEGDV